VVKGEFVSGGSRKNWATIVYPNTEFRVFDVAVPLAEKLVKNPDWCSKIEIEKDETEAQANKLIEEKKRLLARIQEINNILKQTISSSIHYRETLLKKNI
jgi:hypothetical protein